MPDVSHPVRDAVLRDLADGVAQLGHLRRPNGAIHAVRKRVRRVRSLLGLVRDEVAALSGLDKPLRRLGKDLSHLRDLHVVVEMAGKVHRKAERPECTWIIVEVTRRRDAAIAGALDRDPGLATCRSILEHAEREILAVEWPRLSRKIIVKALKKSRKRAVRAMDRLLDAASSERLHTVRRRARRLKMQIEVAQGIDPALVQGSADRILSDRLLHKLTDAIGRLQDLELLRRQMRRVPERQGKFEFMADLDTALQSATRKSAKLVSKLDDKI